MAGRRTRKPNYERVRLDSGQHRRILLIMAVLSLAAFLPVAARLYVLMVRDYGYYAEKALRNQSRTTPIKADRGTIYDCNGNVLACSVSVENVYLAPRELQQTGVDLERMAQSLGQILSEDPQKILQKAKNTRLRYQQIAADVDEETAERIRAYIQQEQICGIHLEPGSKRYYPYGTLAAQVLGFANASGDGCEGIEASYDRYLSGKPGKVITTKGNQEMDMPFSYEDYIRSVPGCSVVLTLDATVQGCLEKRMQEAIDRYSVQNGAFGLVMEVKTGKILAMATLGSYDPNCYLEICDSDEAQRLEELKLTVDRYADGSDARAAAEQAYRDALQAARLKQWRNRVISDGYEPGSTFKVLTMAAALDSGAITLNDTFHCGGAAHIPGRAQLLHCWRSAGHGSQSTAQALQNSCNLAFANIALRLGGETFYEYVKNFGILEKTGIDLTGESKGVFFSRPLVTDTQRFGTASLTSGSFGQTFKLTPLQLVRAIAAVVNGGTLMEPYIVSDITDPQGNTVLFQEPVPVRRVISEETSRTMCSLLRSVVTEGTAKNAAVAGFSIGGKTGTSEKIDVLDENGHPTLDKIVSFVGVAPMDDPQYIVLVALDTPSRATGMYISGGVMAAPTVGAVLSDILPYLGVSTQYGPEDAAGRTVLLPDLSGMDRKAAEEALNKLGLDCQFVGDGAAVTGQLPAPGQEVPGNCQVLLYLGQPPQYPMVEVPDFLGMNRREAAEAAGKLGLQILIRGNPEVAYHVVVTAQNISAGTYVRAGTVITLEFADTDIRD